ncbi:MAG: hypothetical protein QF607_02525 [Nitrospinaceae bacterium]|nr:hypothetical protein [Nitrospinaceae bacterium]
MRRIACLFLVLSTTLACVTAEGPDSSTASYDIAADITLFLSTDDPSVEKQVLERLKSNEASSSTVKSILRTTLPKKSTQPTGLQPNRKFKMGGKTYSYALHVPASVSPDTPMIVVMHGMGGSGANTIRAWVERLGKEFVILCPSYPMGAWWSKNAEELVLKLVNETRATYPINPNRVFLAGLSNGAIGAYLIGMFHPDRFAGIVPIAGSITERYMHFLVNLRNTPAYLIQGAFDPIFPIELTRRVYKILTDIKSPVVYREHQEQGTAHGGHFLPESEVPALAEWLKKQRRNPSPKVVRMTREANHLERIFWVGVTRGLKLAALQIPGPEMEPLNVHDGKIATLFAADKGNNRFEVMGKNLIEFEMHLSSDRTDFDQPVVVTFQPIRDEGKLLVPGEKFVAFHRKVEKDLGVLLSGFKKFRDPDLLFDATIKVSAQKAVDFAVRP